MENNLSAAGISVEYPWGGTTGVFGEAYKCGYCTCLVGPNVGYRMTCRSQNPADHDLTGIIRICSSCNGPSFFDARGHQTPGSPIGGTVSQLPPDIETMYSEARASATAGANTCAVMACRVILSHIAVEEGASKGLSFQQYVDFLDKGGYIPVSGKGWVDYIRQVGNVANHGLEIVDREQAAKVLEFTEFLLKIVYEMRAKAPTPSSHKP